MNECCAGTIRKRLVQLQRFKSLSPKFLCYVFNIFDQIMYMSPLVQRYILCAIQTTAMCLHKATNGFLFWMYFV